MSQLDHQLDAFYAMPARQQEITRILIGLGTSEVRQREALQTECAFYGHAFYFHPTICSACGWEKP